MSDGRVFDEVEEELRRERMRKLWDRYGVIVIGVALAIVLGVGGYKGWQALKAREAANTGARFEEAVQLAADGKTAEADAIFTELAASGPTGYRQLAAMRLAAGKAAAGKTDEAVADFDKIADNAANDPQLRAVARLRSALLRLDTADWTEMQNRLTDLNSETNPWRNPARELLGLAAYKAGKLKEAGDFYRQILADRTASSGLSQRAQLMLSLIFAEDKDTGEVNGVGTGGDDGTN